MAIKIIAGIRDSKANLSNYGERCRRFARNQTEANRIKKQMKIDGFDVMIRTIACPKNKDELIDLLNEYGAI